MPRLWNDTIDAHRRAVRDATLDTASALVAEHGIAALTMSQIAERTGIGRATLYKYFPDVESILLAWHERQVAGHLEHLARVRDQVAEPGRRLAAVLTAYATHTTEQHGGDLAALLHRGDHVAAARQRLRAFVQELIADAVAAGAVRDDVPPAELADFCLHALGAAVGLRSKAAVRRLVSVTVRGLHPDG